MYSLEVAHGQVATCYSVTCPRISSCSSSYVKTSPGQTCSCSHGVARVIRNSGLGANVYPGWLMTVVKIQESSGCPQNQRRILRPMNESRRHVQLFFFSSFATTSVLAQKVGRVEGFPAHNPEPWIGYCMHQDGMEISARGSAQPRPCPAKSQDPTRWIWWRPKSGFWLPDEVPLSKAIYIRIFRGNLVLPLLISCRGSSNPRGRHVFDNGGGK